MREQLRDVILRRLRPLIRSVMRSHAHPSRVTVGWPIYDEKEVLAAFKALLNLQLSQGPIVRAFEHQCARSLGVPHAVAVNSGSSANLLVCTALRDLGLAPEGSEVIVPATTFATVASPVVQTGLVPVYVDVNPLSWNIDPQQIERAIGPKTRAIMAVHTLGNPAPMREILHIARRNNLVVIEDCCEAHGARIGKKSVGSFGDFGTLSFFVAHNITTGEGGMVFTKKKKYYELLLSLREFGRLPPETWKKRTFHDAVLGDYDARYIFSTLGFNVRMTDIAASLGIEQWKKLERLNRKRLYVVQSYLRSLGRYRKYLALPEIRPNTFHSFYAFGIIVRKNAPFDRSDLTQFLEKHGIDTRAFFGGCLPDQPGFRSVPGRTVGKLPISRWIRDKGFFIGCTPALTQKHVDHVVRTFDAFFKNI